MNIQNAHIDFPGVVEYVINAERNIKMLVVARLRASKFIHERGLDKEYDDFLSQYNKTRATRKVGRPRKVSMVTG